MPRHVPGAVDAGGTGKGGWAVVQWTRRGILRAGTATLLGLGAAGCAGPPAPGGRSGAAGAASTGAIPAAAADRVLVLVVMSGGNDGLNTIIPYNQGQYYDGRPTIAVPEKQVLPLVSGLGLHPSLKALLPLFHAGSAAAVQGVGYPNPILSHFRSMAIWQTGEPSVQGTTGWLGRYLDATASAGEDPLRAVAIGATVPPVLVGQHTNVPAIGTVPAFDLAGDPRFPGDKAALRRALAAMYQDAPPDPTFSILRGGSSVAYEAAAEVQKAASGYKPGTGVQYPSSAFAAELQLVVRLLAGGVKTQLFTVGIGGFDDHANEHAPYASLLQDLGDSLGAFQQDLAAHGLAGRVLTVAFSEFGRRVKENASGGTDHGTAGPVFLLGSAVRGGLHGEAPSLAKLDGTGDLQYTTDFRDVFGTVVDGWLGGSASAVFGGSYGGSGVLRV